MENLRPNHLKPTKAEEVDQLAIPVAPLGSAVYIYYSPIIWYRGFYDTVYSRGISTNFRRIF